MFITAVYIVLICLGLLSLFSILYSMIVSAVKKGIEEAMEKIRIDDAFKRVAKKEGFNTTEDR